MPRVPLRLPASVHAINLSRVLEYVYRMEAGRFTVKLPSAGVEYQPPFGGARHSGFAPEEHGPDALEFCTGHKTIYLKY